MAETVDYYAVLGVASGSEDVVIRAAFKALMLKYHPDTNQSADATRRAAAINAAFAVLGSPAKRAEYDRSRQQSDARSSSSPPPAPPPPPRGNGSATASNGTKAIDDKTIQKIWRPVAFAGIATVIMVGSVMAGNKAETTDIATITDLNSTDMMDGTMTDNMTPVDGAMGNDTMMMSNDSMMSNDMMISNDMMMASMSDGPTIGEIVDRMSLRTPTTVNFSDIESAVKDYDRVLESRGVIGARNYSERCHKEVEANPSWSAADKCAAFDYAAYYIDRGMVQAASVAPNVYFAFQAENQADNYRTFSPLPLALSSRLRSIRSAAQDVVTQTITERISKNQSDRAKRPSRLNADEILGTTPTQDASTNNLWNADR